MDRTSSDRQRPGRRLPRGANLPRTSPPMADMHPENGPVEPGEAEDQRLATFNRYKWLINRILTRDYGISSDIEDVKNDVFVAICEGWNRKRESDERATEEWVRVIVHRVAMKHCHRSKRQPRTGFEPGLFESILASSGEETSLAKMIDREAADLLAAALAKLELPQASLKAVQLRFWADKPIAEIAVELGRPVRTVQHWIRQAKAALRRELELMPLAGGTDLDGDGSPVRAACLRRHGARRKGRSS